MKRKTLINEINVSFDDLINLKKKMDELEEKCNRALDSEMYNTNRTSYLLDKRDRAIFTFIIAAKAYYNSKSTDFEFLLSKYEDELKYLLSLEKTECEKNSMLRLFINSNDYLNHVKKSYDFNYSDLDFEMDQEEEIAIKQGN